MDVEALSAKPRLGLLLDHFAKIKDTRQSWKVAYPLREVLFMRDRLVFAVCEIFARIKR